MLNFKFHLIEFKFKLFYFFFSFLATFICSYLFSPNLINILSSPFLKFVNKDDSDFIFTNVFEVFSTYYTLAFYSSCFFNIPLGLYFILCFVKSGLFEYEKKILFFSFKFFTYCVSFSCLFTYYIILPLLLFFLLSFDLITDTSFIFIKMETKIYDYVIFVCNSIFLYCFVVFQVPVLLLTFIFFKRPTLNDVVYKRKIWILFCLIIGCAFSSPDLISLFVVSAPFLFFFEFFVFFIILKLNYVSLSSRELLEW